MHESDSCVGREFRSNCLVWALRKWAAEGGYIAMRRSRHWRFIPHFLHSADLQTWRGFAPVQPAEEWRAALHCLWFLGTVEIEHASWR